MDIFARIRVNYPGKKSVHFEAQAKLFFSKIVRSFIFSVAPIITVAFDSVNLFT